MKLNLGCGDRLMEGYVNVDIFPFTGVTVSDVRSLVFSDDVADEIISVHVIEHIWPWEVEDMLYEWKRVLRDGGKLIIECPNIRKAASILIYGMKNDNEKFIETAMNAFYGDPKDREIYGRHKWGYTPETLMEILKNCGFRNISEKPAMFKFKESRDMRVEAWK